MRLREFNKLSQAVVFHDTLNPAIWRDSEMLPNVREKLMLIAKDFQEFLGVKNFDLKDITVSGSNAAYTYTPTSDIDLHLVVEIPKEHDPELRELFDAKKYQYNNQYDFKIRGYDVELYVQDVEQPHHSMGIFSLLNDAWIQKPKQIKATVDDTSVEQKYKTYKGRIAQALQDDDEQTLIALWADIREMRRSGLTAGGEFSPENLVFKILRTEGDLGAIRQRIADIKTRGMSLEQRRA
jgi:hypothetical protein